MSTVAPSSRWACAVVAASMVLTLHAGAPARADVPDDSQETSARVARTLPLPAPGTDRLIRIGPQALVVQDDRGRVTMADEPAPPRFRARNVAIGLASMVVIGAGVFLALESQYGYTLRLAAPQGNR